LRGSSESELKSHQLSRDPDAYFYTQQGKSSKVNTINDGSDHKATNSAFRTLGFSASEIDTTWNIVAAILHLVSKKFFQICNILAKIPGVAWDSLRNEGTREMNYGIIYKQSNRLVKACPSGDRGPRPVAREYNNI
jgi:hypothetical protein